MDNDVKDTKQKGGPPQVLVVGFIITILVGTLLLMLPISSQSGESTFVVDALFTATSAVCVTGLVVVNTAAHWSLFGKVVIITCIQIGGLGFMTVVSMLFVLRNKRITLKNRLVMQEALSFKSTAGIVRFTRLIVKLTFIIEGIGAFLLSFVFVPEYGLIKGIGFSIFHSISAFCNAGFDIVGENSLMPYVGNGIVNFTIIMLIIIGGLGYSVWLDSYEMIKTKLNSAEHFTWKQAFYKLSLHTKLVWILTIGLILTGFLFFFAVEYQNPLTLGELSLKDKIYASLFQSVSPRTAGFNTLPLADLTVASQLVTILLMFIGGSPAGTAGGIKTVTFGVVLICAISVMQGRSSIVAFRKKISIDVILRALTVIVIALVIVISTLTALTLTQDATFMEIFFETVSAFGTAGLTLGITGNLNIIGKIIIILLMFIGRVGLFTIGVALVARQGKISQIQYPEEKVLIG
ncbi:Trk family potassium uptake protein [Candidatus Epulonipiscium fishelsonii]|uniref:Trk family potassium uptake protein n=1 Tax=Candidatus Epulonipiscium fishelsonii TaxID=77094 RepID=A0ACC8XII1_9FIRM|nr:Trk family potassium uptake protein [Epulopiscium sp. SCG-D08WGA-EpuloA1]